MIAVEPELRFVTVESIRELTAGLPQPVDDLIAEGFGQLGRLLEDTCRSERSPPGARFGSIRGSSRLPGGTAVDAPLVETSDHREMGHHFSNRPLTDCGSVEAIRIECLQAIGDPGDLAPDHLGPLVWNQIPQPSVGCRVHRPRP